MQIGADRGRCFHGVWQPNMQRQLCRFTPGGDQNAKEDHDLGVVTQMRQGAEVKRAALREQIGSGYIQADGGDMSDQ